MSFEVIERLKQQGRRLVWYFARQLKRKEVNNTFIFAFNWFAFRLVNRNGIKGIDLTWKARLELNGCQCCGTKVKSWLADSISEQIYDLPILRSFGISLITRERRDAGDEFQPWTDRMKVTNHGLRIITVFIKLLDLPFDVTIIKWAKNVSWTKMDTRNLGSFLKLYKVTLFQQK